MAAYLALYAFDQQSKLSGDAVRAVQAAARPVPNPNFPQGGCLPEENIADFVEKVEGAFSKENAARVGGRRGPLVTRLKRVWLLRELPLGQGRAEAVARRGTDAAATRPADAAGRAPSAMGA